MHIQSYMDDIKIVLSAAKEIIPDPDKILKYMTDALEEMKNMINMGSYLGHLTSWSMWN